MLVILGLLAAFAIPAYERYILRTRFADAVNTTSPFKAAVETCYLKQGNLQDCDSGKHGIPPKVRDSEGYVDSLEVTDGVITMRADRVTFGPDTGELYTYVLTPALATGTVSMLWSAGGTCEEIGLCP